MKGDGGLFGKKVPKEKYQQALDDLAKAQADSDHWKNEYYRAYADMQNLRKSLEEEHRTAFRYRSEGFLENLLPPSMASTSPWIIRPKTKKPRITWWASATSTIKS
jgi:hypothetical protein